MSYENKSGLGVYNQYGPRDTGGSIGLEHGENSTHVLSITITPEFLNTNFIPPVTLPKGALITKAVLRVDEAFTLTGTTPGVVYGLAGSEVANGVALTQAELQSVGTKIPASAGAGQLAINSGSGVTATTKLGKALTGTTPAVVGTAGKAVLSLTYVSRAK